MHIIVKDHWLNVCGYMHLSGVELEARLDHRASLSSMGDCYRVTLPDGRDWTVFGCRGVTIVQE